MAMSWQGPAASAVTCLPYSAITVLGLPSQHSKLPRKKKKDDLPIHWGQECVPVKASGRPAGLKHYPSAVAQCLPQSSDFYLLHKDPSVRSVKTS